MKPHTKGFTLIELLVVIAIIGLLASIVLVSLTSARVRARDSRRLTDIRSFQTALELYNTNTGHYPYTNWTSFDSPVYSPSLVCDSVGGVGQTLTAFMATYIGKLSDPSGASGDAGYLYINQGGPNDYCVLWWRTPENLNNFSQSFWSTPLRCTAIDSNGKCSNGTNEIFLGSGIYAGGC